MKIERRFIKGYSTKDDVKELEVTGLTLVTYIKEYLKEEWSIPIFMYFEISDKFENGLQVYRMQFTPLVSEERLQEAIISLDKEIVLQQVKNSFLVSEKEYDLEEESDEPTDWEDYWSYESELEGSFASIHFENAKIETGFSYENIITLSKEFKRTFPQLTALLNLARVTKISSNNSVEFYLLG
ncbi:MAG: hypothetical protein GY827_12590 [Cytophagales bacterium]|nr:hypothetical protein [Cytophagales bacterium]